MIRIMRVGEVSSEEIFARTEPAAHVEEIVSGIIAAVREEGDAAVLRYTKQFDGAELSPLVVPEAEIDAAVAAMDPAFLAVLREAADNIRAFHEKQKRTSFIVCEQPGVVVNEYCILEH